MAEFIPENIPEEMKELPRWVLYTLFDNVYSHRTEKLPWSVSGKMADITKPETWSSFDRAMAVLQKNKNYKGLGFVLGDGIFGIDLDHVINGEGEIEPWADEIISRMDTYTELSPSGTGVHIYARGRIPAKDRKNGNIEMYDERRYFTVTGRPYGVLKPLAERTKEAAAIHRQYLKRDHREAPVIPAASSRVAASDVQDLITRAGNARNGEKFTQLYRGITAGYASQSQADQALCNILAFYAGGDRSLIDAAFRSSGLMRSKWDSRRGPTTYGEMTIGKAVASIRPDAPTGHRLQPEEDDASPLPVDIKAADAAPSMGEDEEKLPPVEINDVPGTDVELGKGKEEKGEKERIAKDPSEAKKRPDKKENDPERELFEDVRSSWKRGHIGISKKEERASTGIPALDKRLGGGIGRGIWMLGSEPSIGKTSLVLHIARKAAEDGAEVLYVSFEQEASYLQARMIASALSEEGSVRVNAEQILGGDRKEEAADITERDAAFGRIFFARGEDCPGEQALLDMIGQFSRRKKPLSEARGKPCIVFIDYLQIIPFTGGAGIRMQIDDFARRLRQVQMKEGICVFLISSLNRMSYMGPVRLDSFKESGIIEFTGDVILGLNLRTVRSSEFLKLTEGTEKAVRLEAARARRLRELEVSCLKNKTGESSFAVDIDFDTETGLFTAPGSRDRQSGR